MMIYEYQCDVCKQLTTAWKSVADRNNAPKCECGGDTKKIISGYSVVPDLQPYFDDNLESHIKSKQHRKQVMREQGVAEKYGKGWM